MLNPYTICLSNYQPENSTGALTTLMRGVNSRAGNYDEYFGMATDVEAVAYLMLVNQMLHDVFPGVTTIGEDVSGMPTFCRCAPCCSGPGMCPGLVCALPCCPAVGTLLAGLMHGCRSGWLAQGFLAPAGECLLAAQDM